MFIPDVLEGKIGLSSSSSRSCMSGKGGTDLREREGDLLGEMGRTTPVMFLTLLGCVWIQLALAISSSAAQVSLFSSRSRSRGTDREI